MAATERTSLSGSAAARRSSTKTGQAGSLCCDAASGLSPSGEFCDGVRRAVRVGPSKAASRAVIVTAKRCEGLGRGVGMGSGSGSEPDVLVFGELSQSLLRCRRVVATCRRISPQECEPKASSRSAGVVTSLASRCSTAKRTACWTVLSGLLRNRRTTSGGHLEFRTISWRTHSRPAPKQQVAPSHGLMLP